MSPRTLIAMVSMLLVAALSGCSSSPPPAWPGSAPASEAAPGMLVVSLRDDVTTAQRQSVEAKLRTLPGVRAIAFESRDAAYQRLRKELPDWDGRPADVHASYQVALTDGRAADSVRGEVVGMPGVDSVTARPSPSPTR
ncbi:permease-like cell division protein FtsX [Amycolatopsis taiwanensis]|nr:permease-like cell division protein FtsX [Amycolatopsis taiwanensis]